MGEMASLYAVQGAGVAANAGNTYVQNQAARGQQQYASQAATTNANWEAMRAGDATSRGDVNASRARSQGEQIQAADIVKGAASNLTGPGAVAANNARLLSADQAITTRNNAYRQALGLQVEAANIRSQDQFSRMATANRNRNSLFQLGAETGMEGLKAKYYYDKYQGLDKNGDYKDLPYTPHP